jgi:hypothetical protein
VNLGVARLSTSDVTQRRIARLLRINRKTVVRKFLLLAQQAEREQKEFLGSLLHRPEKLQHFQFDEMETFERSKCLPLSIALAVMPGSRKILGFRVASMPANGPLAEISRKKYGHRKDERARMARSLLSELSPFVDPQARIITDENPKYPGWLKSHFPRAQHKKFKGRRGCIVGQGELKKIGFDPLFDLNHTCAMIRANVSRLARRTWCTTKLRGRLEAHLHLYVRYHNTQLT